MRALQPDEIRVALCHFAPVLGEVDRNAAALERRMEEAAAHGAQWVLTPELCLTGYDFAPRIGSDWIRTLEEDPVILRLEGAARAHGLALFLSHAVREAPGGRCHNAVVLLGRGPAQVVHQKMRTIPVVEGWSARGERASPAMVDGVPVGLLVCADAWGAEPTARVAAEGARLLLSPAAWPPEPHGPDGCWARRSQETGLALLVCNRFGVEPELDFSDGATGVYDQGALLAAHAAPAEALVLVDWSRDTGRVRAAVVHEAAAAASA